MDTDNEIASFNFRAVTDPRGHGIACLKRFARGMQHVQEKFRLLDDHLKELRRRLREGDEWKGD